TPLDVVVEQRGMVEADRVRGEEAEKIEVAFARDAVAHPRSPTVFEVDDYRKPIHQQVPAERLVHAIGGYFRVSHEQFRRQGRGPPTLVWLNYLRAASLHAERRRGAHRSLPTWRGDRQA